MIATRVDDLVLLVREGAIATIMLNRPDKLNALTPAMLTRLEAIVAELEGDMGITVVLLTGTGERAFCVGADVNAWAALKPLDMWRQWVPAGHRVFDRLAALRQPTIALINGFAFGGGLELALATDLRLAAAGATFALPEASIGTLPGWAGTRRLPDLVGPARAKQMIFTGSRIDVAVAERWGLVNEVVPPEQLMSRAMELAGEITANAPVSVQLAKAALDGRPATLEAIAGALAATTDDGREGVTAFREKRGARFRGR